MSRTTYDVSRSMCVDLRRISTYVQLTFDSSMYTIVNDLKFDA